MTPKVAVTFPFVILVHLALLCAVLHAGLHVMHNSHSFVHAAAAHGCLLDAMQSQRAYSLWVYVIIIILIM